MEAIVYTRMDGNKKYVCPFSRCSSKYTGKRKFGTFSTKGNLKRHLEDYHTPNRCKKRRKINLQQKKCDTVKLENRRHNYRQQEDDIHRCPFDECKVDIKTLEEFLKHIYVNHSSAILSAVLPPEKVEELMKRTEHIKFPIDYTKILPPSESSCSSISSDDEYDDNDDCCGICVNCYDGGAHISIRTTTGKKKQTDINKPYVPDLGIYECPNCKKQFNHFSCLVRHVHETHLQTMKFDRKKIKKPRMRSSSSSVKKLISDISLTVKVTTQPTADFHITVTV